MKSLQNSKTKKGINWPLVHILNIAINSGLMLGLVIACDIYLEDLKF